MKLLLFLLPLFITQQNNLIYDARNDNIVTPVKDQGSTNLCWAYASISASETSILKDKLSSNINLNPTSVAYNRFFRKEEPLNNAYFENETTSDYLKASGSPSIVTNLFSQWYGPTNSNDPVNIDPFIYSEYKLEEANYIDTNKFTLQETINQIKENIINHGAVTFSYNNNRETKYYNAIEDKIGISHACTIIGWDDTIDANNYYPKASNQNGGWLIKNSYSSLPYFYLSYNNLSPQCYSFKYAKKDKYDFNYFYDGMLNDSISTNLTKAGNIFKAQKGDNKDEYIKAINISINGYNVNCKLDIYTNVESDNPVSENHYSQEETFKYPGIHTIELNDLIKIKKDSYFSVCLSVNNLDNDASIAVSNGLGNSYRYNTNWVKYNYFTPRIKAYTILKEKNNFDLSQAEINFNNNYTYTGSPINPNIEVKLDNNIINEENYSLNIENNINVGQGKITISGLNNYYGNKTVFFNINPNDINNCLFELDKKQNVYNKNKQFKGLKISFNNNLLIEGEDYNLDYENNINAGNATILITGINNFTNNKTINFTIKKSDKPDNIITSVEVHKNQKTLNDIPLPSSFQWINNQTLLNKDIKYAEIEYILDDKENYKQTTFEVKLIYDDDYFKEFNPLIIILPSSIILILLIILFKRLFF